MRKVVSCLDVESVTCMPSSADTFFHSLGVAEKTVPTIFGFYAGGRGHSGRPAIGGYGSEAA